MSASTSSPPQPHHHNVHRLISSASASSPSTTAALRPLPAETGAKPVAAFDPPHSSPVLRPALSEPNHQRPLHSRFPSFSRIRTRKANDDAPHPRRRDNHSPDTHQRSSLSRATSSLASVTSSKPSTSASSLADPDADSPRSSLPPSPQSHSRSQSSLTGLDAWDSGESRKAPGATQQSARPTTNKLSMHQTSSRLLRMTDDDRPFTRDFQDLFSTLMVSLPLTPHRVRFSKVEHTFTTEEAITNLGSLKFSQSNRMPDPKDPSRIVTTTTTTTFSMAKEMARSVCTKFLEARFIESCEGRIDFTSKNGVWQLTPKGMRILTRFCSRNGIHQRHVNDLLDSPRNMMQLVILERDLDTDKINHDRAIIEVIFRRFTGDQPNLKSTSSASDTESLAEYATGLVGVRLFKSRKPADKDCPYIFNGKSAIDWLMDCCMVVDRRECLEIANFLIGHDLINRVPEEKDLENRKFQPTKTAHFHITQRGMKLAGWMRSPTASINGEPMSKLARDAGRDSNNNKMMVIMRDPALRLLFREFLIDTHCEENLTFYVEVKGFLAEYTIAKRANPVRLDLIRENLASAYSLYNAFLAPGSPCELNIDHNLRNALAGRMTRAVGEDAEMVSSLDEVAVLFDQAQSSVFKLMASDSVPKFARDPKYATVLRDRNLEHLLTGFHPHH